MMFDYMQQPFTLVPFVFVKRESVDTQDVINDLFGDLILANNIKVPVIIASLLIGILTLVLAVYLIRRAKQESRQALDNH